MSSFRTSLLKLFDATVGALACHVAGRLIYWAGREIHLEPCAQRESSEFLWSAREAWAT